MGLQRVLRFSSGINQLVAERVHHDGMQEYVIGEGRLEGADSGQKLEVIYGLLLLCRETYQQQETSSSIFAISIRSLVGAHICPGAYRLFTQDGKVIEMENSDVGWRVVRAITRPVRNLEQPRIIDRTTAVN